MYQSVINKTKPEMQKLLNKLQEEFNNVRTGRASTGIVENVVVNYYGTQTPLKQMASITTPDASSIVITPWDQSSLGDIEQAIRTSDLGFNPVNDGKSVRISLPPLTEERRKELVKLVHDIAEEVRVGLRNLRQDAWNEIKTMEKDSKITEDDRYDAEKDLNKLIEEFNKKIEELSEKKETELMKV